MNPQDIINHIFAIWVKSGMYYRDFSMIILDLINSIDVDTLMIRDYDDGEEELFVIPLRKALKATSEKFKNQFIPKFKIFCYGKNIRFTPDIDESHISSPIDCKIERYMKNMLVLAMHMFAENNINLSDKEIKWNMYEMSMTPIYYFEVASEMNGIGGGKKQNELIESYLKLNKNKETE